MRSRRCSAEYFKKSIWWEGPQWLRKSLKLLSKNVIKLDFEILNSKKRKKTVITATNVQTRPIDFYENSTSYKKMTSVTSWIYIILVRNVKSVPSNRNLKSHFSFDEINNTELAFLIYVQKIYLSNETINCYISLQTITDNNRIIRVRTRIALKKI